MQTLNNTSIALIKDLPSDITDLLKSQSNIELIWKLEKLHSDLILTKTADLIRLSLLEK